MTLDKLEATGNTDIHQFLSKNEDKTAYLENETEKLADHSLLLAKAQESDILHPPRKPEDSKFSTQLKKSRAWSSKKSRFNNLFQTKHGIQFLIDLYWGGQHLMGSKIMNIGWMSRMTNKHGGVSMFNVMSVHRSLTICADPGEPGPPRPDQDDEYPLSWRVPHHRGDR